MPPGRGHAWAERSRRLSRSVPESSPFAHLLWIRILQLAARVSVLRSTSLPGLPLGDQRLEIVVVLLVTHDVHVEQHRGVIGAAQFRALSAEDAFLGRGEEEVVRPARYDVQFLVERRNPERMDDVL